MNKNKSVRRPAQRVGVVDPRPAHGGREEGLRPHEVAALLRRGPGARQGLPAILEAALCRLEARLYAVGPLAPREVRRLQRRTVREEHLAQL